MATDPVLRMLGLARRAGKLAYGDELVREACFDHKTRCVFIAEVELKSALGEGTCITLRFPKE